MTIPGKIRTDFHSKQLKCHDSFNVPAINTEWWYVIKTPLLTEVDDQITISLVLLVLISIPFTSKTQDNQRLSEVSSHTGYSRLSSTYMYLT